MEIQERTNSLRDYINILKRRKLHMLITFMVLMILTMLITFSLPAKYRSVATILLEDQEVSEDFDQRKTAVEYADARVYKVQQRALTSINLSSMIDKFSLYKDDIDRVPRSELIEKMRKAINQNLVSADVIDPRSGRPTRVTIAFDVSFDHASPVVAQKVTSELVDLYRSQNIELSMGKADETADFYKDQVERANREVLDLEDRLARFKSENEGALPEFVPLIMQLMQKIENDVDGAKRQLSALEERKIYLESSLIQTDPNSNSGNITQVTLAMDGEQEIEFTRGQLRAANATYGPNHPDVKRLQQKLNILTSGESFNTGSALAAIDEQISQAEAGLSQARQNYGSQHPEVQRLERTLRGLNEERVAAENAVVTNDVYVTPGAKVKESVNVRSGPSASASVVGVLNAGERAALVDSSNSQWNKIALDNGVQGFVSKGWTRVKREGESNDSMGAGGSDNLPSNPAYIQLQANLASVVTQMRALQGTLMDLSAKGQSYAGALSKAPLVEREYSAIMRDLNDRRGSLQAYKQQLERANFGLDVMIGQKGQRFTLIEPPIAPVTPQSPNRLALLFLGLVLSLFGTIAAAVIAESLDNSIRSAADLADISGSVPLAAIPVMENVGDKSKGKRKWVLIGMGAVVSIPVILAIIHFAYRELDVLWFVILRQLGL